MKNLKKIVLAGLLLATSVVFNRFFSIKTPIVVISFGFIPKIIIATIFGPWWSILLFGLADLIGALLFPFGAYFVGYTITACLSGFIYGIFLHRKKKMSAKSYLVRLIISCLLSNLICNLLLNSIWIMITTKKALAVLLPTRLVKELVTVPIYIAVMFGIHVFFEKYKIYDMVLESTEDKEEDESETDESEENKNTVGENATAEKSESLTETSKNLENEAGESTEPAALNDNSAGESEKQAESKNGDNKNEANS